MTGVSTYLVLNNKMCKVYCILDVIEPIATRDLPKFHTNMNKLKFKCPIRKHKL